MVVFYISSLSMGISLYPESTMTLALVCMLKLGSGHHSQEEELKGLVLTPLTSSSSLPISFVWLRAFGCPSEEWGEPAWHQLPQNYVWNDIWGQINQMVMTLANAIKDLDLPIYAIQHTLTFSFSRLADPPIILRVWLRTLNSIQSIFGATTKM